jgi:diacylglycerol kinase (ATP)
MLNKPNLSGLPRMKQAFFNSLKGLKAVWQTEEAFRQEIWVISPLLFFSFWLSISVQEHLWLVFSLVLVLLMELLNTALEYLVDRISTEHHPLSGHIKDIGSALVLISIVFAIAVWGIILGVGSS